MRAPRLTLEGDEREGVIRIIRDAVERRSTLPAFSVPIGAPVSTSTREFTRVRVIDSHTGGEPTRVVIEGGPDLGGGSIAQRLACLRESHDDFRLAVVNEPRGSDVMVGALLCEPENRSSAAGVIFFNNVGYLGMCSFFIWTPGVSLSSASRGIQPKPGWPRWPATPSTRHPAACVKLGT